MNVSEILGQIFLLIIVTMSVLVAREFYKSKDGYLRALIILLFAAKIWVYGGAFIFYQLTDMGVVDQPNPFIFRLALNTPMLIIMILLYKYIKTHNK